MKLYQKKEYKEYSWNFGPKKSNNKSVLNVVNELNSHFNNSVKIIKKPILSKKYWRFGWKGKTWRELGWYYEHLYTES